MTIDRLKKLLQNIYKDHDIKFVNWLITMTTENNGYYEMCEKKIGKYRKQYNPIASTDIIHHAYTKQIDTKKTLEIYNKQKGVDRCDNMLNETIEKILLLEKL